MNKLLKDIEERLHELNEEWKDEPHDNNHIALSIMGEIDGLKWVYELITGKEFEF